MYSIRVCLSIDIESMYIIQILILSIRRAREGYRRVETGAGGSGQEDQGAGTDKND